MSELIYKQEAIIELIFSEETKDIKCEDMRKVLNVLKKMPSAETECTCCEYRVGDLCCYSDVKIEPERKNGKWIQPCDITGFGRCSSCNALWDNSLIENRYFRYCPRCGAVMREGEEE